MTQCERLLERLKTGPINPMQAWQELGIYRLAARVSDLRDNGYVINRRTISVHNRYQEECRVAEYSL